MDQELPTSAAGGAGYLWLTVKLVSVLSGTWSGAHRGLSAQSTVEDPVKPVFPVQLGGQQCPEHTQGPVQGVLGAWHCPSPEVPGGREGCRLHPGRCHGLRCWELPLAGGAGPPRPFGKSVHSCSHLPGVPSQAWSHACCPYTLLGPPPGCLPGPTPTSPLGPVARGPAASPVLGLPFLTPECSVGHGFGGQRGRNRCVVIAADLSLSWTLPTTEAAEPCSLEEGPPAFLRVLVGAQEEALTAHIPSRRKAAWHWAECTFVVLTRVQTCQTGLAGGCVCFWARHSCFPSLPTWFVD